MTDLNYQQILPQLRQDVLTLRQDYESVYYDPDDGAIVVEVELGSSWTPRIVPLRILFSERYPQAAPRVALPWTLRCHGVVPRHMLISGQYLVRGQLGDKILYYPEWQPTQTLHRLVDTLVADLTRICEPDEPRREVDA